MTEEFILKAGKSFQKHVDTKREKNVGHIDLVWFGLVWFGLVWFGFMAYQLL